MTIYRTRQFFYEMGLRDAPALEWLCKRWGNECYDRALESIHDVVMWGCFRDAEALHDTLMEWLSVSKGGFLPKEIAHAAKKLGELRAFKEVPTKKTALEYCGFLSSREQQTLVQTLGDTVPEWFFAAVVLVARRCGDAQQFIKELGWELAGWRWGYEPMTSPSHPVAQALSGSHAVLRRRQPEKWFILTTFRR